jgi:hypothetical protein
MYQHPNGILKPRLPIFFLVDVFAEYLSENKSNRFQDIGRILLVAYNQNFRQA